MFHAVLKHPASANKHAGSVCHIARLPASSKHACTIPHPYNICTMHGIQSLCEESLLLCMQASLSRAPSLSLHPPTRPLTHSCATWAVAKRCPWPSCCSCQSSTIFCNTISYLGCTPRSTCSTTRPSGLLRCVCLLLLGLTHGSLNVYRYYDSLATAIEPIQGQALAYCCSFQPYWLNQHLEPKTINPNTSSLSNLFCLQLLTPTSHNCCLTHACLHYSASLHRVCRSLPSTTPA